MSSELLASAYFELGNYKKAYNYLRIYENIRNELFNNERKTQVNELNTKYETHKKESLIEAQNAKLEKKDIQIKQRNIGILLTILFLSIFIGFSFILFIEVV